MLQYFSRRETNMTATESSTIHNTFVIERNFPQHPARVFSAFAQPALKRRWYAEGDHEILDFHMDFRLGGSERFRYRFKEGHPIAGSEIANESTYQDILEEKRIVMTTRMSLNGKPHRHGCDSHASGSLHRLAGRREDDRNGLEGFD
ncbi:MAG: SRPBCC domain-containing protein [Terracidiphilus sp.]